MFFIHRHELDAMVEKSDMVVMPQCLVFHCDRSLVPDEVLEFLYWKEDDEEMFDWNNDYNDDYSFSENVISAILSSCQRLMEKEKGSESFFSRDSQFNIFSVGQVYQSMMAHTSPKSFSSVKKTTKIF